MFGRAHIIDFEMFMEPYARTSRESFFSKIVSKESAIHHQLDVDKLFTGRKLFSLKTE